ncbi:hypothetical protein SEA_DEKHOCKEY33_61 [Gordonia phage DekHockey33]|nr:hypothetical protein SEA_DEKHOCKEY33_61 [Gordonia phage DekHockey33]WIC40153.1 hypothetical protein SEA_BATTLESHIP_62 [Gordonia phage Battleship]
MTIPRPKTEEPQVRPHRYDYGQSQCGAAWHAVAMARKEEAQWKTSE